MTDYSSLTSSLCLHLEPTVSFNAKLLSHIKFESTPTRKLSMSSKFKPQFFYNLKPKKPEKNRKKPKKNDAIWAILGLLSVFFADCVNVQIYVIQVFGRFLSFIKSIKLDKYEPNHIS